MFLKSGGMNKHDDKFFKSELSKYSCFEEFVIEWLNEENVNKWIHFIPQYKFLIDKYKTIKVDYVAKLENIEQCYSYITNRLGLESRPLRKDNVSQREKDYRAAYSIDAQKVVASVYAKDIELFGYKF